MRTSLVLFVFLAFGACKEATPPVSAPAPVKAPAETARAPTAAEGAGGVRTIPMQVTVDGFVPEQISLKAGQPVKFVVTRVTDETCAKDLLIDGTDIKAPLPLNQAVEIAWTPAKAGKVNFGCAMGMMVGGVLLVE
jgi:plastocyanin domain-containing protein